MRAVAAWQKKHGVTLAEANKNGDTLFLLQGRNENAGVLWADRPDSAARQKRQRLLI